MEHLQSEEPFSSDPYFNGLDHKKSKVRFMMSVIIRLQKSFK